VHCLEHLVVINLCNSYESRNLTVSLSLSLSLARYSSTLKGASKLRHVLNGEHCYLPSSVTRDLHNSPIRKDTSSLNLVCIILIIKLVSESQNTVCTAYCPVSVAPGAATYTTYTGIILSCILEMRVRQGGSLSVSQAARQGIAVLMASVSVVLKHETSTLRQRHNFISIDLKFGLSDYVREVTNPDKVGSGPMSGRDAK